jgi:hypothetical protein
MIKKMNFGIEGEFYAQGITLGQRWNGFHCPYFTYENALKVLAMQESKQETIEQGAYFYEISEDKKGILEITEEETNFLSAKNIEGKFYYPIGFCNWVWMEIPEDENED